jgi:hypothetical protein
MAEATTAKDVPKNWSDNALGFMDLQSEIIPLAIIAPLLIALAGLALKKQDS